MACVIQVIETAERRGNGRDQSDPIRGVVQYYSFDGDLLAENDPINFGMSERSRLREALFEILSECEAASASDLRDVVAKKVRAALSQDE